MIYQYGSRGSFHDNGAYRYWILCKQLIKTLCALLLWYSNSLQAVWYGDWIALWSHIFRTRPDWSWVTPHLYNRYQLPFPVLKRLGCGLHHPPISSAEVKERVELYLNSPLGLYGLFRLNFTSTILLGLVYLITVFFDRYRTRYLYKKGLNSLKMNMRGIH